MSKRKIILLVVGLLSLIGAAIALIPKNGAPMPASGLRPQELPFSVRGAFAVGIHEMAFAGESPLELTIWYPASVNEEMQKSYSYPYMVKIGQPLGNLSIASSTGQAIPDATPDVSAEPHPLVILSPGFSIGSTAYAWMAEHLASYGFVVVSPDHQETLDPQNQLWRTAVTRPQDILSVCDYIDEQVQTGGFFTGWVDAQRVAVIGHSYGGYTALVAAGAQIDTQSFTSLCQPAIGTDEPGAWLCEMLLPRAADMAELAGLDALPAGLWPDQADSRVDAVVSMAGDAFFFGQTGLAEINVPVLAIGGTADVDSPYLWSTYPAYVYTSGPRRIRVALQGAEHMIFTGPCQRIPGYLQFFSGEFCSDTTWNRIQAQELTKHFTTAFLLAELDQDSDAANALSQGNINLANVEYEETGY